MVSHKLTVYSILYHPTIHEPSQFENSCRGVFPTRLMSELPELDGHSQPITFSVRGDSGIRTLHVCAHEFSAQDDILYLPRSMMESAFLQDGDTVSVEYQVLPKATFLVVQPLSRQFSVDYDLETAKVALEKIIVKNYPILEKGEEITLENHTLIIRDIEPYEIVSTFDSDPQVDFLPALDEPAEQAEEPLAEQADEPLAEQAEKKSEWKPFGGTGYTLSGGHISKDSSFSASEAVINPSTIHPPTVASQPSIKTAIRRKPPSTSQNKHSAFQAFAGAGNRLGT
jgi:hypothetical protein